MKKNLMIKVASLMLVLTLASTCMIGTTFAKYVTADQASDTARVAKWGITVSTSGTLFGEAYENDIVTNAGNELKVQTSSVAGMGDNIVAPGTKNDVGFQVSINGDPEVAYEVAAGYNEKVIEDIYLAKGTYGVMVKATGLNNATNLKGLYKQDPTGTFTEVTVDDYWVDADGTEYYALHDAIEVTEEKYFPVQWKVVAAGGTTLEGGTIVNLPAIGTTSDLTVIAEAIKTNIDALEGKANTAINASYTLTWKWDYNVDTETDKKDTILGNLIANLANVVVLDGGVYKTLTVTDNQAKLDDTVYANLDITFGLDVTVTQVD